MKVRTRQEPWTRPADGGNPKAQPFKQLEMSVKRAYQLNSGLIDCLKLAGDLHTLKADRAWWIVSNKDLRDSLSYGNWGKEDPAIAHQDVWEWMVDHWYRGGLKRSVVATMDNLTTVNRNAIDNKVDELYE